MLCSSLKTQVSHCLSVKYVSKKTWFLPFSLNRPELHSYAFRKSRGWTQMCKYLSLSHPGWGDVGHQSRSLFADSEMQQSASLTICCCQQAEVEVVAGDASSAQSICHPHHSGLSCWLQKPVSCRKGSQCTVSITAGWKHCSQGSNRRVSSQEEAQRCRTCVSAFKAIFKPEKHYGWTVIHCLLWSYFNTENIRSCSPGNGSIKSSVTPQPPCRISLISS